MGAVTQMEETVKFFDLPPDLRKLLIKDLSNYLWRNTKFKHLMMLVGFICLSIQTRKLAATYLEFQTVVKVKIENPETIDLPAITVCTDIGHVLVKSKLRERFGLPEDTDDSVYRETVEWAKENLTVNEWFQLTVDPEMILTCRLRVTPNFYLRNNLSRPSCEEVIAPYYSLPEGAGVCWTFFSQLNKKHQHPNSSDEDYYKVDVPDNGKIISFTLVYDLYNSSDLLFESTTNPFNNEDEQPEILMILHHPKTMPSAISLDRASVRRNTTFEIFFSQTNAYLLRWPYRTDCVDYEKDYGFKKYKSSSHCIDGCLTDMMIRDCNCIFNQSRGGRITKWSKPEEDLYFCKEYKLKDGDVYPEEGIRRRSCAFRGNYESDNTRCTVEDTCNSNCYEEYYRFEVKEVKIEEEEEDDDSEEAMEAIAMRRRNKTWANVTVTRKDTADMTYQHTAEMSFVEFVCYFGGLLGLWLGISILDMYNAFLRYKAQGLVEYGKWVDYHYKDKNRFGKQNVISVINSNYNTPKDYGNFMSNVYY